MSPSGGSLPAITDSELSSKAVPATAPTPPIPATALTKTGTVAPFAQSTPPKLDDDDGAVTEES